MATVVHHEANPIQPNPTKRQKHWNHSAPAPCLEELIDGGLGLDCRTAASRQRQQQRNSTRIRTQEDQDGNGIPVRSTKYDGEFLEMMQTRVRLLDMMARRPSQLPE